MRFLNKLIILSLVLLSGCSTVDYYLKSPDNKAPKTVKNRIDIVDVPSVNYEVLAEQNNTTIDSLYIELEFKEEIIDSLLLEISQLRDNIIVSDIQFPSSIMFAGQTIDLTNERNLERFEKAYKNELKSAVRYLPRSGAYFALMDSIFSKHNIPLEAKYLAIAESRLSYRAHSFCGADGIWQIMPLTAKFYKLQVNDFIDERRDIFKSTELACKYLKDSYRYFEKKGSTDWLLSFCAYNAGMGSVNKILKSQGGTKFSELIFKAEETNQYVWKAIAIKYIFDNEEQIFSKKFPRDLSLLQTTEVNKIKLNGHYKIDSWAKANGTTIGKVYDLNPWIKIYRQSRKKYSAINDVVLPAGTHNVLIPVNTTKDSDLVASIEKKFLDKNAGYFTHHVVKSGDNLYNIARKYKTTVTKIKQLNGMKSNMIKPGQKLKLYGNVPMLSNKLYTVKKGDSISGIGKKLNLKASKLIKKNNLKKSSKGVVLIYPGQKLSY